MRKSISSPIENEVVFEFDPNNPQPLTPEQKAEIEVPAKIPDSELDYSDITPLSDEEWENKVIVGNPWITPPTKTLLKKVMIDSDIVFWILRQAGEEGYQEKMNTMLREAMEREREKLKLTSTPV